MNRFLLSVLLLTSACANPEVDTAFIPDEPSRIIDGVQWVAGNWQPHLAAGEKGRSWGNHRAVVHLDGDSPAVEVRIPWRRTDRSPEAKAVVVVDSVSGEPLSRVKVLHIEAESGSIAFTPHAGSSTYYVYYLPWESTGGYYPRVTYPSVWEPDGEDWEPEGELGRAHVVRIESVDDFHSFFPMEVPATAEEAQNLAAGRDWYVVPEHGRYPIRMRHAVPHHWTLESAETFVTRAHRDESHFFQLGVVAANVSLSDIRVSWEGFDDRLASTMTCLNCGGTTYTDEPLVKKIDVAASDVQPLWIGVQIPPDMPAADYEGTMVVETTNAGSFRVPVVVEVDPSRIRNHGFDDPASQSRLAWLDSRAGRDPDFVIELFDPVSFRGQRLSILGRHVELGPTGLPATITSTYTEEMTAVDGAELHILAEPMMLWVQRGGSSEQWQPEPFDVRQAGRGRAEWTARSRSEAFDLTVDGALEYDGMLDLRMSLKARVDVEVEDVALPISYDLGAARWMLGLGQQGRARPDSLDWKWKVENHQEGLWLGGINRGMQYVLRDENYVRPLNTNFYQNQPLNMPESWFNDGKGGIRLRSQGDFVLADNYSGPRTMRAGETLHFNARLLITPFKPLDTTTHFNTRFVHKYVPVDSVLAWGGTVVNIHHANEINPYINYPFFNLEAAKAYIDEAHAKGVKVKLYNTIRELTYRAHELFAMRSLGTEIFNDGEGGGHSWMQEHLREDYHAAWHAYSVDDAALLNKGTSRWTNYYIEGLSWLAANQEIDGLYLDDIAFSRETVKRMISVLDAERDEVVIDLHSANQFNPRDGFINSAMLYMEHFPFISRLWFGEYFDYGQRGDYWMTEVSGLPFGLMGEMLEGGGHPYRGLLYGMTTRMYGDVDPRPVWKMMNEFGIADSRMLGYWLEDAPVRTGNDDILATAYVKHDGTVLIVLASWADEDVTIRMDLSDPRLGLSDSPRLIIPEVQGLQEVGVVPDGGTVLVPGKQGLFLLVQPQ